MSVLNIERPDFMREESVAQFEDMAAKFFAAHAPESRVAKWRSKTSSSRSFVPSF